jgi:competence protein ComEC
MGTVPLVLIALGGLWTAIWRTRIRWAGGLLVAAGLAAWAIERPPDVLIAADGALAAVNLPGDRGWAVSRDRGEGFLRSAWQRMWGGEAATNFLSAGRDETASGFLCDGLGCVLEVDGRMLAIPATAEAAAEDCARAQIVVTAVPIRSACPAAAAVIDRDSLRRGGAHAVWLLPDRIRIRSVAAERGRRPWVVNADR